MTLPAIAAHCKKIDHRFTPVEAAYLIYASERHTIPEKYAAWTELMETQPDTAIEERPWLPHADSLHELLREYMRAQDKYIAWFYRDEPNCAYAYQTLYQGAKIPLRDDRLFSGFASCYAAIKEEADENEADAGEEKIVEFQVTKQWLIGEAQGAEKSITLHIDGDNHPLFLEDAFDMFYSSPYSDSDGHGDGEVLRVFSELWPEIPTPFCKGDIVVASGEPFVLEHIPYWNPDGKHTQTVAHLRAHGDHSDLCAIGYIVLDGTIYREHCDPYLNLDYCTRKLNGMERIYTALSGFLKGNLSVEALLHFYDILKNEQHIKEEYQGLAGVVDEALLDAVLKGTVQNNDRK